MYVTAFCTPCSVSRMPLHKESPTLWYRSKVEIFAGKPYCSGWDSWKLEQNIAAGNKRAGDAHEAIELVWWAALISLYSQLLPHSFTNTPCSHCVQKSNQPAVLRKGLMKQQLILSFLSNTGRASYEERKKQTPIYLLQWGLSCLPVRWADSVASFAEESQQLQWKLQLSQLWCQEIPSSPHEMTREDFFLLLKTITLSPKGSPGDESSSSCPQVTGL